MIFTKLLTVVIPREGCGMRWGSENGGLSVFSLLIPGLFELFLEYVHIFLKQKAQKSQLLSFKRAVIKITF